MMVLEDGKPIDPKVWTARCAYAQAQREYWMRDLENRIRCGEAELSLMDEILPPLEQK